MASRSTIRTWLRTFLGAESDDPAFSDAILNPILQQATDALLADLVDASPGYLSKTVTLEADSASSHLYTFATQSTAVEDFARWLEVRWTDEDGSRLDEARLDELGDAGADHFAITGPDETPVLQTSKDSTAGEDVWMRYAYWPAEMSGDASEPGGIPSRFHDVIALEALFAFGLGGEQSRPRELELRWRDRRAQLLTQVSRRGTQPSRTRVYDEAF